MQSSTSSARRHVTASPGAGPAAAFRDDTAAFRPESENGCFGCSMATVGNGLQIHSGWFIKVKKSARRHKSTAIHGAWSVAPLQRWG